MSNKKDKNCRDMPTRLLWQYDLGEIPPELQKIIVEKQWQYCIRTLLVAVVMVVVASILLFMGIGEEGPTSMMIGKVAINAKKCGLALILYLLAGWLFYVGRFRVRARRKK